MRHVIRFLLLAALAVAPQFATAKVSGSISPFSSMPCNFGPGNFFIETYATSQSYNTTGLGDWVNTSTAGIIEGYELDIPTGTAGWIQFDIGAVVGNDATIRTGTGASPFITSFEFGDGLTCFFASIREVLVSGTEGFIFRVGFNPADIDGANGCYWRYTHSVNSGKYQLVARGSSTETAVDSGVTYTAGTLRQLAVVVPAAGGACHFYNNGVEATNSPITTGNVPTNLESTGCMIGAERTAGTTANTEPVAMDHMACGIRWTTPQFIRIPGTY